MNSKKKKKKTKIGRDMLYQLSSVNKKKKFEEEHTLTAKLFVSIVK